jgi:hypothetical protein
VQFPSPPVRQNAAIATLIWIVLIVAAVIAIAAMTSSNKTWEDLGKDRLLMDRDIPASPRAGSVAASRERDEEIRQMLEARNARRLRRGEEPVDVEQELRELTGPQVDPQLRQEIRQLVEARNYRRARAGKPPLDVDAEIEREIARLGDVG